MRALLRDEAPTPPEFYVRRAKHVRFAMGERKTRIDGKLTSNSEFVDIHVVPGGVKVLLPKQAQKPDPSAERASA